MSYHKPLKWILTTIQPAPRLARFRIRLENFKFKINYREGKKNGNADALSRLPLEDEDESHSHQENLDNEDEFLICCLQNEDEETHIFAIQLSNEDLSNLQLKDINLKWIFDLILIHKNEKPSDIAIENVIQRELFREYDNLRINNENLFRHAEYEEKSVEQFVLPENQIITVIEATHDSVFGSHLGMEKTWSKIKPRFYFYYN